MTLPVSSPTQAVAQALQAPATVPALSELLTAARTAQAVWASTSLPHRLAVLRRFRHLIAEHAEELSNTVPRPIPETLTAQIIPLADHALFLERHARRALQPRRLGFRGRPVWLLGTHSQILREPVGIVLIIAPANYPIFIPGTQILQALAAGNAVLLKPAPSGRPAALALTRLLNEAGLDPRLISILASDTETAAAAVDAAPDAILLTGSSDTGRSVLAAAARHLTPCTVELSGCDAVFVRADADLHRVAAALRFGLYLNDGATCIAPRRVFVHHSRIAQLESLLRTELSGFPPIPIDPRQAVRLRTLYTEACHLGARPLAPEAMDWSQPQGPIVLSSASSSMALLQADLFAPVLALVPVDDDEQALAVAAHCPFALGASVFSADEAAARRLAIRIDAGTVTLNDLIVPTADPRTPFGGRRGSGYGVTRGIEGLLQLTRIKVIASRRGNWLPHLQPADANDSEFFSAALRAAHAATAWRRLLGGLKTLRLALNRRPRHPGNFAGPSSTSQPPSS